MTKYSFTLFLMIISCTFSFAQTTTYNIEKLKSPTNLLKEISSAQVLKYLNVNTEKSSIVLDSVVYYGEHPFLTGLLTAYKEHRPFTISPDIIWLLICQGFARHVVNNAEELRSRFVDFSDKKRLIVEVKRHNTRKLDNNWEQVFPSFTEQISAYTGKELIDVLTADFSTSSPITHIASQITIMEAMKKYFDFEVMMAGCGIPKITIEGSVNDWEKVLAKAQYLSRYELDWWTKELEPILSEIVSTKKGHFKKRFWMKMVKVHTKKKYGSQSSIDGWISKFFPYTKKGEKRHFEPIITIDNLASEIVKVPFVFNDITIKKQFDMEFWSGFIGLSQNKSDYTLRPEIAWIVSKKD